MLFSHNSSILQILQDQTIDPVEQAAYNNDVRYRFNDLFLDCIINLLGKFTFNPGLFINTIRPTSNL
jgi:hypothetical protein